MSFLTPLYLIGALGLAIPIILHLLHDRPKNKQAFGSLMSSTRPSRRWIASGVRLTCCCCCCGALRCYCWRLFLRGRSSLSTTPPRPANAIASG